MFFQERRLAARVRGVQLQPPIFAVRQCPHQGPAVVAITAAKSVESASASDVAIAVVDPHLRRRLATGRQVTWHGAEVGGQRRGSVAESAPSRPERGHWQSAPAARRAPCCAPDLCDHGGITSGGRQCCPVRPSSGRRPWDSSLLRSLDRRSVAIAPRDTPRRRVKSRMHS